MVGAVIGRAYLAAMPSPAQPPGEDAIAAQILRQTIECGPNGSVAPNDIARALEPEDWRRLLGRVRQCAMRLARAGRIQILRKGKPVEPEGVRGVIRLRIVPTPPA